MGGKLHVYKRPNSSYWQCATYLAGKNRRRSTGEDRLTQAKDVAEDWYLELRGKQRAGQIKDGKTFRMAAEQFLREYPVITHGQRNRRYVEDHGRRLRLHLLPFFGEMILSEITAGTVQEYRVHRATLRRDPESGDPILPAHSTLHQEIVVIRQVLKTAHRHGWIAGILDLSPPYQSSSKVAHRAWFSPMEYRQLYEATRERAHNPRRKRWTWQCQQLHDYVLFMANTGLRPDEAIRLEHRDVTIVRDRSGRGETGRRTALKMLLRSWNAGSIPAARTMV